MDENETIKELLESTRAVCNQIVENLSPLLDKPYVDKWHVEKAVKMLTILSGCITVHAGHLLGDKRIPNDSPQQST